LASDILQKLLQQEIAHDKRTLPRWLRWEGVLAVAASAILLIPAFHRMATTFYNPAVLDAPRDALLAMQLAVWIIHFAAIIRCLFNGAYMMSREHTAYTWETLILSHVNVWQLFVSKWRAALRRVGGWMVALGLVRLMILPIGMVRLAMPMIAEGTRYYMWCVQTQCPGLNVTDGYGYPDWRPELLVLAPVMAALLTLLDILCCTALGLMAGALLRRPLIAFGLAVGIRFAIPLVSLMRIVRWHFGITNSIIYLRNPSTGFALVDSGTAAILRLLELPVIVSERLAANWVDFALAMGMLTGLLVVSLLIMLLALRRKGAMLRG